MNAAPVGRNCIRKSIKPLDMKALKLHNGKPAKDASLKEINRAIQWFSDTIEKYKKNGLPLAFGAFSEHKAQLEAYRSDRIGKKP